MNGGNENITIVPGDVFSIYKLKDDGTYEFAHIMMVYKIKYSGDTREAILSKITFIEAASGFNNEYYVLNTQKFWAYIKYGVDFEINWYEFSRLKRNYQ